MQMIPCILSDFNLLINVSGIMISRFFFIMDLYVYLSHLNTMSLIIVYLTYFIGAHGDPPRYIPILMK